MLKAFEQVSGLFIQSQIVARRGGESACYARADKAAKSLGWAASRSLDDMCGLLPVSD
jgi:UDP-glucose 4-epimerase